MSHASPADRSPIPLAEAPRDCPLCPRLVGFREALREEHPGWWNAPVPHFGDPGAWLAIVGAVVGLGAFGIVACEDSPEVGMRTLQEEAARRFALYAKAKRAAQELVDQLQAEWRTKYPMFGAALAIGGMVLALWPRQRPLAVPNPDAG